MFEIELKHTFLSVFDPVTPAEALKITEDDYVFRASSLSSCPKMFVHRMEGGRFNDLSRRYFTTGTRNHYYREKLTQPGIILENETRFFAKHSELGYYITGQTDVIFLDEYGLFLLDYKTVNLNAFYYKLRNGIPDGNKKQLGIYKWLYYLTNCIDLMYGGIRFNDRMNHRNHLQLSIELPPLDIVEKGICNHPTIQYYIHDNNKALETGIDNYHANFSFFCKTCEIECKYRGKG